LIYPNNNLLWGHRSLKVAVDNGAEIEDNVFYFNDKDDYVEFVIDSLEDDVILNTVNGSIEFGPRAMCATSTLALPTAKNVESINAANGRDTVMPFAPVMMDARACEFFSANDIKRVIGSLRFMIMTLDYHSTVDTTRFRGIMHPYPSGKTYSGRPQIVHRGQLVHSILEKLSTAAVINTSFNVHGVPIVYSIDDAIADFHYNMSMADQNRSIKRPVLVIGDF